MNSNQTIETKTEKLVNFTRRNAVNLVIVVVCLVFILKGLTEIAETGKTVAEIIGDGVLAFLVSFTIKTLEGQNGIDAGKRTDKFLGSKKYYGDTLEKQSPIQEHLDAFCDYENAEQIKRIQRTILRRANLGHFDLSKPYNPKDYTKQERKAIKKALRVKIYLLTPTILLSEMENADDETRELKQGVKAYQTGRGVRNFVIGAMCAFVFAYYGLKMAQGYAGIIWASVQVSIYLILGLVEYINCYNFIIEEFRNKIIRKANYLEKFMNMYNSGALDEYITLPKRKTEEKINGDNRYPEQQEEQSEPRQPECEPNIQLDTER